MGTSQDEVAVGVPPVAARWRVRSLVSLCVLIMLACYWPTTAALSQLWLDTDKTTFTHGFIVLAITFWLILRDERFEQLQPRPNVLALFAYLLGSLGWLVTYRASIETAHELAFPLIAAVAVFACFGMRVGRLALFPIAFLIFAIPIWDVLTPYLQTVSAAMVGHMLHLSGISAYVDGSFVHIGVGTFEIAGGCSGLHFVMVGLALGALYGELGRDSIKSRASLIGLAFLIAVAANWVRVYVIVVAGYLTNMQHYLVRVEHYRFGWCVFAVMMIAYFWIASRFPAAGETQFAADKLDSSRATKLQYVCIALTLLLVPAWTVVASLRLAAIPGENEMRPADLSSWRGPLQADDTQWHPVFVGADTESLAAYERSDAQRVYLYVAAYRKQKQDSELVGYHNHLIGESDNVEESRAISKGTHEYVLEHAGNRDLLRFSYRIGELSTGSGLVAQLAYGLKSLWSAPLSRIIAVRVHCSSDCDAARQTLDAFESAVAARATH